MAVEHLEPSPGIPPEISHEHRVLQAQANVATQQWQAAAEAQAAPGGAGWGRRAAAFERADRQLFPPS